MKSNLKNTRAAVIYLKKYISGKTLDYGAGSAKYRNIISSCASEYTAFDMSPGTHIDVVGDAHAPPFANNSFNTVVSTQMLEHVERPWIVVKEIGRILKPGGRCLMLAPFMVPYHADPHDYFRYTKEGMESLFKNEGFEIEESGTYGRAAGVLAEMIHFSFFSHYKVLSPKKQKWRDRFMRLLKSAAYKIDPFLKGTVVYADAYVVARKLAN